MSQMALGYMSISVTLSFIQFVTGRNVKILSHQMKGKVFKISGDLLAKFINCAVKACIIISISSN